MPQLVLVGDQVQRGDAAAHDGETDDRDWVVAGAEQGAGLAVYQHRLGEVRKPRRGGQDLARDRASPGKRRVCERAARPEIHPEDHVRVEYLKQRVEIAALGGGQEGIHHPALPGDVTIWLRGRLHPAACPAGELTGRLRGPVHDLGDVVEGNGEHIVQDEREPFGGAEGVQHHKQCQADPSRPAAWATLARRRISLSAHTPREILAPLATPLLFALVIAPALAKIIQATGRGGVDYSTFVIVGTVGLLIPLTCTFAGIGVIVTGPPARAASCSPRPSPAP